MKKRFRGFTLVECIVAMAILGIASLLVAQIYAAVSTRNRMNQLVNASLVHQMQYVEKYTNSDVVSIEFGTGASANIPPHNSHAAAPSQNPDCYVTISKVSSYDATTGAPIVYAEQMYSYPTNIYVLKSRDRQGGVLTTSSKDAQGHVSGGDSGYGENNYNLRYKYMLGQ